MGNIPKENIVETSQYKQGVKQLIKKHKTETLSSLKQIIDDLCNFRITTQYHNHKLTNIDAYELHVNNEGDVLLVYRYSGDALIISLQLIDLTKHKQLKNTSYQKQLKKTIKNLNENKGNKNMVKESLLKEDLDKEFDREYEKRFGAPQTRVFTSPEEFFKFREDVNKFVDEFYEKHKQIN